MQGLVSWKNWWQEAVQSFKQRGSTVFAVFTGEFPVLEPRCVSTWLQHVVTSPTRNWHKCYCVTVVANFLNVGAGFLNDFLVETVKKWMFSSSVQKLAGSRCEYLHNFWASFAFLCWFLSILLSHLHHSPLFKKSTVLYLKFLNWKRNYFQGASAPAIVGTCEVSCNVSCWWQWP